jgi:hypothetical protein
MYLDQAMIMLPSNYTKDGSPVPLVIGCHGAGGNVSANSSQTETTTLYKYLVANGYAVCDCNGLPKDFADLIGINENCNVGSPIAMECYIKLYQYVQKHFNVSHDVLISGGSMGGLSSTNLVLSGTLPIIAQAINCPVLDTHNEGFLNPWPGSYTAISKIYNFAVSGNNYVYNEEKLRGFNPMVLGMESYRASDGVRVPSAGVYNLTTHELNGEAVIEYKTHPCPIKIWHCENDSMVPYQCSQRFVSAIRNGGGNAVLRSIVTGDHNPLEVGDALVSPAGNTSYRGGTLSIKPIVEEIYLFFKRYTYN